jgi:hypothetical protein
VADRLISKNQSAFIKGRFILESVVVVHEIIHDIHRNKESGVILKLDCKKAYDRISWSFLEEMLISRCFGKTWVGWIMRVVRGGSLCVRINDENSKYFKPRKGLRQGDPLSPLLFNLVAGIFTRMLIKAVRNNLIARLLPQVIDGGVINLQYADDTLLFLKDDLEMANNLKWLLLCYEQMTGMSINFDKSDLLTIGMEEDRMNDFAKVFCCKKGSSPLSIWGFPFISLI